MFADVEAVAVYLSPAQVGYIRRGLERYRKLQDRVIIERHRDSALAGVSREARGQISLVEEPRK